MRRSQVQSFEHELFSYKELSTSFLRTQLKLCEKTVVKHLVVKHLVVKHLVAKHLVKHLVVKHFVFVARYTGNDLETQILRPVQTAQTCWSNIFQHCWMVLDGV